MPTPDDHFAASPHCRVPISCRGRVGGAGGCPTVRAGIVCPAGVKKETAIPSAPDDHFTAAPDRLVKISGRGHAPGVGGCPTVRIGIVSPAGVKIETAIPSA